MNELLEKYKSFKKEIAYLDYACFIINFDQYTDCPTNDKERSADVENYFEKKVMDIVLSDEYKNLINDLYEIRETLDEITRKDIEIEYKRNYKQSLIPKEELYKHIEDSSRAYLAWENARESLDYNDFLKELDLVIKFEKNLCTYWETDDLHNYDVLLDDNEEGYNKAKYDKFFNLIEERIVPFANQIINAPKKYNPKLDKLTFDIDKQKKLTKRVLEVMGYDNSVGCVRETAHPFTNWANNNDVRITTNYHEDMLLSNLYSVMHEAGHALYQLHMDSKYNDTNIFNNVTCIEHESQSRFYENYLGRRRSFVEFLYPILVDIFPKEFEGISVDDLYYYINDVKAQLYRTEADELTYPIHVLIRYKVEIEVINGNLKPKDMEGLFNKLMYEYLGIMPQNKKEGVFQDVHWSGGFGYFPTYAVGSAFGAQFLNAIMKDIDIDADLKNGNFKNINAWLTEHIHKYSGTMKADELLKAATNEEFDPEVYVKYLIDKFSDIYLK